MYLAFTASVCSVLNFTKFERIVCGVQKEVEVEPGVMYSSFADRDKSCRQQI